MKLCRVILVIASIVLMNNAFAAGGFVTGTVKKLRTHQYLTNTGWDKYAWFCLNVTTQIGACKTTPEEPCGGAMVVTISKDASKEIYSSVLAAQMSNTQISVYVDDSFAYEGYCYARILDVNTP